MNPPNLIREHEKTVCDADTKLATKTRNQANLTRIASTLQQRSNNELLASIGDFLSGRP